MFSNLRTEGDMWNHYIVPESIKIWDTQDDLIEIDRFESRWDDERPVLHSFYEEQWYLRYEWLTENLETRVVTYYTLRNLVSRMAHLGLKDIKLTYTYKGETHHLENAETHPELSKRYPYLLAKLILYRFVIPPHLPNACQH